MRLYVPALALLIAAGALGAERHKPDIDPESQDGILLQRIQQEPTLPRKLVLLERFVAQYPKAPGITWVYDQLLPIYMDAKQYDKVFATAEAQLAADPDDLDSAHYALQMAEMKKDADLVNKYAQICWDLAAKAAKEKRPTDPDDIPDWNKQVEFSKQVMAYSEFLMATQAADETDTKKKAELVQALEKRNPQSRYLEVAKSDPAHVPIIAVSPEKAFAIAEKGLADDPDNVDFLMTVADHYMSQERDLSKVLSYSLRVLEVLPRKGKPDSISEAEWEKKKAKYTAWANWMAGVVYGKEGRYGVSDKHLRAAVPYLRDNARLLAAAYFYLGYDNYAMAGELHDKTLAQEAVRFSKLCAAIDGPFRMLAQRNLEVLRNEYNIE